MCRKVMDEIDDLPSSEEEEAGDTEDTGETARFTREALDNLLRSLGGWGTTSTMEFFTPNDVAEDTDEWRQAIVILTRAEMDCVCYGNGAAALSDDEWDEYVVVSSPPDISEYTNTLVSFTPSEITTLMLNRGITATVSEFLNGQEETPEITMTVETLSARLLAMGGTPLIMADIPVFTHGQLGMDTAERLEITAYENGERMVRRLPVLNPEEDALLGPA